MYSSHERLDITGATEMRDSHQFVAVASSQWRHGPENLVFLRNVFKDTANKTRERGTIKLRDRSSSSDN
jgi:hypothetical protein